MVKKSTNKYRQIRVSMTDDFYLLVATRSRKLGLTKSAYLKMLAGQDLAISPDGEKNAKTKAVEEQVLPELITASQACIPQVVVIKEQRKRRAALPVKKKTVTKAAIWQYL